MEKKTVLIAIIALSSEIANSQKPTLAELEVKMNEAQASFAQKIGDPLPGEIKIVPEPHLTVENSSMKQIVSSRKQMQKNGFIEENSEEIDFMFNIPIINNELMAKQHGLNDPRKPLLVKNVKDLPMAYDFREVPPEAVDMVYSFEPALTYSELKQGWVGAAEAFKAKGIGNCIYRENNTLLSYGSATLSESDVTYLVNNKPTISYVKGHKSRGFIYCVEWYQYGFMRNLDCVTKSYSKKTLDEVIQLATTIDKNSV